MGVRRVRIVGVFSVRAQWSITFAISSWVLLSNSVYIIAKRTLELHLIRHYLEAYLVKCRVLRNKRAKSRRPFFNVLGIVAFCTIATILRERETSTGPFLFMYHVSVETTVRVFARIGLKVAGSGFLRDPITHEKCPRF